MMNAPTEHDLSVWKHVAETHSAFLAASQAFFSDGVDRVAVFRDALKTGRDKFTVCHFLPHLKVAELQDLFDVLVEWSSTGHCLVHVFRDAILSLPRDWVLPRIEAAAEPYLQAGRDDEYRRFMELYVKLNINLTLSLARRASAHLDPEIRAAGEEFLDFLGSVKMGDVFISEDYLTFYSKVGANTSSRLRAEGRAG